MVLAILMAATMAQADNAAIKKELLGYWKTGRHVFLYKDDGIAYMMGGCSNRRWDVLNGMYYEVPLTEGRVLLKQIKLSPSPRPGSPPNKAIPPGTMNRVTKAEADVYGQPGVTNN